MEYKEMLKKFIALVYIAAPIVTIASLPPGLTTLTILSIGWCAGASLSMGIRYMRSET